MLVNDFCGPVNMELILLGVGMSIKGFGKPHCRHMPPNSALQSEKSIMCCISCEEMKSMSGALPNIHMENWLKWISIVGVALENGNCEPLG